jgi:hypothetical protein
MAISSEIELFEPVAYHGKFGNGVCGGPKGAWIVRFGEAKVKKENRLVPQRRKKFNILSHSSHPKKWQSVDQLCHTFHHKLTTKTPPRTPVFLKKPLQKPHSTTANKFCPEIHRNPTLEGG